MAFLGSKVVERVNSSIKPIIIVSKLAGVCTIVADGNKGGFTTSRFMVFIVIVVSIVSILHLMFIPYAVIYLEMMPEDNTTVASSLSDKSDGLQSQGFITKMTNIILISVAAITVRISCLFKMHRILPSLLESIGEVDGIIIRRNNDSVWILTFSIILIVISWPYQLYSILMVTTNNWIAFVMFCLNLYNNFSIIACELQFVSLCWILKTRFEHIYGELRDLGVKIYIDLDESVLGKINRIRESHKILTECCTQLNALYDISLFAILGSLTLNVLFNLYFALFGGFKRDTTAEEMHMNQISGSMDYVIWSFYYFGRFLLVCMAAGRLTKKANSPKKSICSIFHKSMAKDVKQELWVYLAYVMSNKIQFNACGFFKIDVSLITSVVSTGATYLVILAQFQSRR